VRDKLAVYFGPFPFEVPGPTHLKCAVCELASTAHRNQYVEKSDTSDEESDNRIVNLGNKGWSGKEPDSTPRKLQRRRPSDFTLAQNSIMSTRLIWCLLS
jgi:hypothetical protein